MQGQRNHPGRGGEIEERGGGNAHVALRLARVETGLASPNKCMCKMRLFLHFQMCKSEESLQRLLWIRSSSEKGGAGQAFHGRTGAERMEESGSGEEGNGHSIGQGKPLQSERVRGCNEVADLESLDGVGEKAVEQDEGWEEPEERCLRMDGMPEEEEADLDGWGFLGFD